MARKRIAVVGLKGLPAFGGAAAVGENIIEKLKTEFEFTILSASSHTELKTGYINGVKQIVFKKFKKGSLNTTVYYLKCLFHCLFNKYDLIHVHHAASGFITPFLRLRSKVVVTLHGVYSYTDPKFSIFQNSFFRFCEKLNVKCANEVVSVSKPDQEFIFGKYNRNIKYIPNGIDVNQSADIAIKGTDKKYILFAAGRIFQTKGLHLLVKAAKKNNLEIEIIVAGDIDQVEDYKKEILELMGDLKIKFIGLIKDKYKLVALINNASFFVFPSLNEAMSMMLLEVVSVKTPVIASDIPSNKAVFSDDEVLFFESGDYNDLADKLNFAINNEIDLKIKAQKAFDKLRNYYTWEKISDQYQEIYKEYLK